MLAKDSRKTILSEPTTDALKTYLKEVACIPPLSTEAEFDLARAAKNGNEEARKGLIRGGLQLVIDISKEYAHVTHMTPGDKIEEGNLGLLRAVEGFIAEGFDRGRNFREYAPYWIHQAIKRAAINSTKKLKSEE